LQEAFVLFRTGGSMLTWIILAVIFVVLIFAYMRVRGRRLG
jgi:hypothetical protein